MAKFKKTETGIRDLLIIEPLFFEDERGFFMETYSKKEFKKIGIDVEFVQDNQSKSKKGVFRGLHFQNQMSQGKLVRVIAGSVLDVAIDLRRDSDTFGNWHIVELSAENKKMFYIPEGFAHGFITLEDDTEYTYKCTNYYAPEFDCGIIWNDPELNIDYQFEKYGISIKDILLSEKDQNLQTFKEFVESGVVIK
jgi:dTDP-4-dehydrorhamnose 3,5-epimerase